MKYKIVARLLASIMTASLIGVNINVPVPAAAAVEDPEENEISSDELLWAYLYDADLSTNPISDFGKNIFAEGTANRKIYDSIKQQIHQIMENPDTAVSGEFTVDLPDELGKYTGDNWFTAEDLGLTTLSDSGSSISNEAMQALKQKITNETGIDLNKITKCLFSDCAAELFWRGLSYKSSFNGGFHSNGSGLQIGSSKVSITFYPSDAFKGSGENEAALDSTKLAAVKKAKETAAAIVAENASKSDYQKLLAYANKIADLTDYNNEAVSTSTPYGNPWQMIWVFDGDESTKVVCEGYSKAFQYLCDLTRWTDSRTECYYISGDCGGAHAWNIVRLKGKSYLTDITNYDITNREDRFCLFLGGTAGSVDKGYTFTTKSNQTLTYTYTSDTLALFGEEVLSLADKQYSESSEGEEKTDLSALTAELVKNSVPYNGIQQKPSLIVKDGNTVLTENIDYTVDFGNGSYTDADTYMVTITGTGNYKGTKELSYEITKADFAASAPTVTFKAGGNKTVDLSEFLKEGMAITGTESANTDITCTCNGSILTIASSKSGTGNITVSTGSTANYNAGKITIPVTVSAKNSVTLSIGALDKTYDGTAVAQPLIEQAPSGATYRWEQAGQELSEAPKDAGDYKLIVTGEDEDSIYTGEKTFTISPKTVTPMINGKAGKVYDGTPELDNTHYQLQLSGVVNGETVAAEGKAVCANASAGETTLFIREITLTGNDAKNYKLSDTDLTTSAFIEKYTYTNVTVANSSANYGSKFILGELQGIPAFLENEAKNADLTVNWITPQSEPADAGTYKYTVTIPETDNANAFTTAEADFVIRPIELPTDPIDITVSTKDTSVAIDLADYINGLDGTITLPNDINDITINGTVLTITPVDGAQGTQTVELTVNNSNNYITNDSVITINITFTDQESITLDAEDIVKPYNGKPAEPPVITAKRGDKEVTAVDYVLTWSTDDKNPPMNAGEYQLTITLPEESAYVLISPKIVNVIITAVPVTVKPTDVEIEKGGILPTKFDVTYTGFVEGDDADNIVVKPAVWTCDANADVAGEYKIVLQEKASLKNENYKFVYESGKLIVKESENNNPGEDDNTGNSGDDNNGGNTGDGGNDNNGNGGDNNNGDGGDNNTNSGSDNNTSNGNDDSNGGNTSNSGNTSNGSDNNTSNNGGNDNNSGNDANKPGSGNNNTSNSSNNNSGSSSGSSGSYTPWPYTPTTQQPTQPTTQQPSNPATQQPSEPTAQQPETPTTQQPSEPTAQQPETPTTETSATDDLIITNNGTRYEIHPETSGETPTVSYAGPSGSAKGSVRIPNTIKADGITYKVTKISENAFKNNKQITKVTIGSNIRTIGAGAFSGCNKITKVTFGKEVTSIGKNAFKNCTKLQSIKIGSKVKTIGANAFSGCKSATRITIGNHVTTIGDHAFSGCTKAISIKLSTSLKAIGNNAFNNCTAVKSITIPSNVSKIGKTIFADCSSLKTITFKTTKLKNENTMRTAFQGVSSKVTIKVPKTKLNAYTKLFQSKGLSTEIKIRSI